jgi:hypothetical protein
MEETRIKEALANAGELMVVLESDREYDLHPHDSEIENGMVMTEGINEEGEYIEATFPCERVEHFYLHREA